MSIEQDVLERLRQLPLERQREVLTFAESLRSRSVHEDRSSQQEFEALAERWRNETMMLSSPTKAAIHPSYQRIGTTPLNRGHATASVAGSLARARARPRSSVWRGGGATSTQRTR